MINEVSRTYFVGNNNPSVSLTSVFNLHVAPFGTKQNFSKEQQHLLPFHELIHYQQKPTLPATQIPSRLNSFPHTNSEHKCDEDIIN